MKKILLALLTFATTTGAASAQQRTFYDADGKVTGRERAPHPLCDLAGRLSAGAAL